MIPTRRPYADISLALPTPEVVTPNFGAPEPLQPPPDDSSLQNQMTGLGKSLWGLRKRFGAQGKQIQGALSAPNDPTGW